MRLSVRHVTRYAYAPDARRLALRLRLWPSRHDAQRPLSWRVSVNGAPVPPLLTDAFGDSLGLWHAHEPLETAEIVAEGEVETEDAAGVVRGLARSRATGVFLRETPLTRPDAALEALAEAARAEGSGAAPSRDRLAELHALMAGVHAAIDYRPGTTDSETTAARALALGAGVCQDQTHVFVAAARLLDAPARYVAGYFLGRDPAEPAADGDADAVEALPEEVEPLLHETHAWAEAHVEGLGWVAFDPTHEVCPTDRYVRLCAGLDAAGAAPLRGSVTGETEETLEARVDIAPAAAQSQSQQ